MHKYMYMILTYMYEELHVRHEQSTVNVLNIWTPEKFVVINLKFELCGSTIE